MKDGSKVVKLTPQGGSNSDFVVLLPAMTRSCFFTALEEPAKDLPFYTFSIVRLLAEPLVTAS